MPDDDFYVRRFASARDAAEIDRARVFWEDACVRKADLARGLIRGFKFPGATHGLKEHNRGEALTVALMRMLQMGENFRGHTGAEFRAAVKRAVWLACMDVGREELGHDKRSGGSLDHLYEGSDAGRFDGVVERYLRERTLEAAETAEAELQSRQAIELVHWAIAQITHHDYREILELTFIHKLSGEQIAQQLGITPDNVYKRRERALKKLEEILRDHRP